MDKNDAPQGKVPGKKPACQTQNYKQTLSRIEPLTCDAYLMVFDYIKQGPTWISPADTSLPRDTEVVDRDGLPVAVIDGKEMVGYSLITFLMFGSPTKGLCHVQIGALIMEGIHDISLLSELKHYKVDDPASRAFAMVKPVKAARQIYTALKQKSPLTPGAEVGTVGGQLKAELPAMLTALTARAPESTITADDEQQEAMEREAHSIDAATGAVLAAFNDDLPEESFLLQTGKRKVLDQFCFKIQFGRLLQKDQCLHASLGRAGQGLETFSNTPDPFHSWKRLLHVALGGYRSGMSFHGAPVLSAHKIPFSTSRFGRLGLQPFAPITLSGGKSGDTFAHCSFVRSLGVSTHHNRRI